MWFISKKEGNKLKITGSFKSFMVAFCYKRRQRKVLFAFCLIRMESSQNFLSSRKVITLAESLRHRYIGWEKTPTRLKSWSFISASYLRRAASWPQQPLAELNYLPTQASIMILPKSPQSLYGSLSAQACSSEKLQTLYLLKLALKYHQC